MSYNYGKNNNGRLGFLKRWRVLLVAALVIGLAAAAYLAPITSKPKARAAEKTVAAPKPVAPPPASPAPTAVEAGLLPWRLGQALSRMSVFQGSLATQLVLAGGLMANSHSSSGIYTLNTANGQLQSAGTLPAPVHDAAGAMVGNSYGIFGGGDSSSVSAVYAFSAGGTATRTGSLAQARSDAAAVNVDGKAYIIGGYNGVEGAADIVTTPDGTNFTKAGTLPVPVRYPAVAALGGKIYVFGGEATKGNDLGKPTDVVQIIDTASNTVSLAPWKLPVPLQGAAAFVVNNELYLAGGQSSVPETITPGAGTTQVPGVTVAGQSLTYNTIWAVDTSNDKFLPAGTLQLPVAYAGSAVLGSRAWIIGGEYGSQVLSTVQAVMPNGAFGVAGQPGAGSPYYGDSLMVADRGNNRLLVMDSSMNIVWKYPSATTSQEAAKGFYFPDDAFFINHGTGIISNQEDNNTVIEIAYPSGKILWTYGHPLQSGAAPGYLKAPDDAYLLNNNEVVVADDQNCRIQFINQQSGQVAGQIGTTGVCQHKPGVSLGAPNGDTPLYDGNVLISEIRGSWVSEYTPGGKMVWTTHLPISYPSDPQQLGAGPAVNPDDYLIADYASPGSIVEFTREGTILHKYQVASGPGMLNHPSLVELLPSGVYMANDDYRHRMVAIDPATGALVWQYGISDRAGSGTGMLQKPDGFDLLLPNGTTPTHGATE